MRPQAGAYELLERLRWGGAPPACPHCGVTGRSYYLAGSDRRTRTGAATGRRVWKCGTCRRQFSVLVGTILQGTRLDLWTWIAVLRDWSEAGPLEARHLVDRYDLSHEAARAVVRRIATAAALLSPAGAPATAARGSAAG